MAMNDKSFPRGTNPLEAIQKAIDGQKTPPVHLWNPDHCGELDLVIRSDGSWIYAGTPIGRPAMVKLFSTVLRREPDGSYVLVTPVEKLGIEVEDAPFVAVEMTSEGEGRRRRIAFRLNTDDFVVADAEHPITIRQSPAGDEDRVYVHVRSGLDALLARSVYYELAELALGEGGPEAPHIWSSGTRFSLKAGMDAGR